MTGRYRKSKLAATLESYGVGITPASLGICPIHHRMFNAHIVRNRQFLIKVLMQELEENNVLKIAFVANPR